MWAEPHAGLYEMRAEHRHQLQLYTASTCLREVDALACASSLQSMSTLHSRIVAVVSGCGRWVSICDLTSASAWDLGTSWRDVDVSGKCRQRKLVTSAVCEVSECIHPTKFKIDEFFKLSPLQKYFHNLMELQVFESVGGRTKNCDGPRTAATSPLHSNHRPEQVRKSFGLLSCMIYWNQPCGHIRPS